MERLGTRLGSGYEPRDEAEKQLDVGRDMSVAADVSDWIVTLAPLNDKKSGKYAMLSTDNAIVQRRDPENEYWGCVSYTQGPLPPGQVWQVTVLETTKRWRGYAGLVSGCVLSLLCCVLSLPHDMAC